MPKYRNQGAPWATLFLSFLLVMFLGLTLYASIYLYHVTRQTVQDLGLVSLPIHMPQFNTLLGQQNKDAHPSQPHIPAPPPQVQPGGVNVAPRFTPPAPDRRERLNILLLGVDRRPDEKGPPRTDTIIVLSVDPKAGTASMLSIPRDLWVPIPGYDMNAKINVAYAIGELRKYPGGGPALIKKTVSDLIGYPIHYYVLVDFNGFRKLIDLIGGIEVCVPKTIHDEKFPTENYGYETLHIEAGCQHMDGDLALKYARTRHVDSDYGRARRQQQVILAVRDKILQAHMLPTLITHLPEILHNLSGSVETDIPLDRLVALARMAQKIKPDNIQRVVIDNRYGKETYTTTGAWILVPDREKLRPLFDRLFAPEKNEEDVRALQKAIAQATATQPPRATPRPTPAAKPKTTVNAGNATVVVLNGSGRPGLAAQVSEWLETQGFHVVQFGDVADRLYPYSVLVVHTDRPQTREALMQLFRIRPENVRYSTNLLSNVDMELFIGADFELPNNLTPP